jgi:transposase
MSQEVTMARPLVTDELWTMVQPLLPPPLPRRRNRQRRGGRAPLDDRKALTGILFVLKTGLPWEALPREMGCGCGMTCWRRLRDWHKAGVWRNLHRALLDRLNAADKIDWSRAVVDSTAVRALHGGKKQDRVPWTGGKTARSTTCWSMDKAGRRWPSRSAGPTATT